MYDCQSDRYTEFSSTRESSAACHSLRGTLTAHPLPEQNHETAFDALEALARRHGYGVQRAERQLQVQGIHLSDALAFNSRFAAELVIDCDLRHAQPVEFQPL
jgi:hypothetical protein